MKCVIPGGHLKVFGKALHSLSRIGDELWFDPLDKGLALRAVSSSRSAYACVVFSSFFFHSYHKASIHEQGHGDVLLQLNCKFSMKSLLPVFRCLSTLERNVEKCHIYINFNSCHMVFHFLCKHGLTKTHNLTYEDCKPLQAVFTKASCPNVLKIQSRVLSDIIIHFPTSQEEVTVTFTPMEIIFKSYSEEDLGNSKLMHTEIHLSPDEFDYFQIGVDSEVTFSLKEVRGLLSFAETTSALITINFSKSGQPIVFSMDDMVFEANFILATLAETEYSTSSQNSHGTVLESIPSVKKGRGSNILDKSSKENVRSQLLLPTYSPKLLTKTAPEYPNLHTIIETELPHPASYNKFHTLFFGAISSKQQEPSDKSFKSLATASEDEDEGFCRELSQTF
ncbi:cell cycle checkpoint control protein RAD9B [Mixophyes fleayi]|uniref:cell cycle checkpoint control protein RAD9B n=1 Tax=Mixophyes fleayi TaxID=3061075 RepID=UPI003F4DB18F